MKISRRKIEHLCMQEMYSRCNSKAAGSRGKEVGVNQSKGQRSREVKKKVQAGWKRVSGAICDRKKAARVKGRFYRIVSYYEVFSGLDFNHFVDYILMRW